MAAIVLPVVSYMLTGASALMYTVPDNNENTVTLTINNQDTVERKVSLWVCADGESATNTNRRITNLAVPPMTPVDLMFEIPLTEKTKIYMSSDLANKVAAQLTGRKRTI